MEEDNGGRISEWNEGTFKSARLNDIQDRINFWKLDLLGKTKGKFNYMWLLADINNLLGEGHSKYSDLERKEVDIYRNLLKKALIHLPPTQIIISEQIGGTETSVEIHKENYDKFIELMLLFEREVKDLNDKHGLTTMNRDDDMGDPYN